MIQYNKQRFKTIFYINPLEFRGLLNFVDAYFFFLEQNYYLCSVIGYIHHTLKKETCTIEIV